MADIDRGWVPERPVKKVVPYEVPSDRQQFNLDDCGGDDPPRRRAARVVNVARCSVLSKLVWLLAVCWAGLAMWLIRESWSTCVMFGRDPNPHTLVVLSSMVMAAVIAYAVDRITS